MPNARAASTVAGSESGSSTSADAASFTVRKISHGEGVERVFQTHSPSISEVEVKRRGSVRRAKLYYLRDLSGKAARIEEKV